MQDIYKLIKAHKKEAIKIVNHNGGKIFFYKGVENVKEEDYQKEYNKIVFDEGIDACPCVVIDDGDNGISKVRILGVKTSEKNSLEFLYLDTDCGQIYWDYDENCLFNTEYHVYSYIEKQGKQKPTDKIEPKFHEGDTMRTWKEANAGYTDGMPVVVSVDDEFYHCTNELIAIKDQDDYEFPPINVKQKPNDKVEPKFKVGDWVVLYPSEIEANRKVVQISRVERCQLNMYWTTEGTWFGDGTDARLWTIEDAQDGDVLQLGNVTAIFKKYIGQSLCWCYCSVESEEFEIPIENGDDNVYGCHNATPATKEQCDLLFNKMKEAGYEWNAEKKKLKKIEDENDRT